MATTTTKHFGHQHRRPLPAALVDDIVAQLSALGHRYTEPRRLVISTVAAQGRPFTAEELCESLPCVGRAPVYRGLRLLVETDPVCRALLEDHDLRYQLIQPGHHHHLLCVICGVSADLGRCDAEEMLREAAAAGFPDERPLAGSVRPVRRMRLGLIDDAFYFCIPNIET